MVLESEGKVIERISLGGIPCFDENSSLDELAVINYIFGPNGAGKTSISQSLISVENNISISTPENNEANDVRVYNRNYVRRSFTTADGEEPGVFLLGDTSREIFQSIEELEAEREKIRDKLASQRRNLADAQKKLADARADLAEVVWHRRVNIPPVLADRMTGLMGSKEQCLERVIASAKAHPERGSDSFPALAEKAITAFDEKVVETPLFPPPPEPDWDEVDLSSVLSIPIVGSADIPLADFINRLAISDWVREGLHPFYSEQNSEGVCPFCQQVVPDDFPSDIKKIFDETYQYNINKIGKFRRSVETASRALSDYFREYLEPLKGVAAPETVSHIVRSLELALNSVEDSIRQKIPALQLISVWNRPEENSWR